MTASKSALVTGANKGIGHEVARRLATIGFKVWLGARDRGRGTSAAQALRNDGLDVEWLELDVTSQSSVATAAKTVAGAGPSLDVLVNNAGIAAGFVESLAPDGSYTIPPSRETIANVRATYDVNVFGAIRVTQAFLPLLLAAPTARIVMVSSYQASLARASDTRNPSYSVNLLAYGSSKTALNAVTVSFAKELEPKGVKVNAAAPGFTATDLNAGTGRRTVQQAAEIVVRLATLSDDGPTGGYFDEDGPVPW